MHSSAWDVPSVIVWVYPLVKCMAMGFFGFRIAYPGEPFRGLNPDPKPERAFQGGFPRLATPGDKETSRMVESMIPIPKK